jgi:predicted nicotinamide N-methyase
MLIISLAMAAAADAQADAPADADSAQEMYAELGFLFDSGLQRSRRTFTFGVHNVSLQFVDDEPGAVQSGHYLWPAAPALAEYLVANWPSLGTSAVLELGCGCGLAGLVAAQAGAGYVLFTDHDFGKCQPVGAAAKLSIHMLTN